MLLMVLAAMVAMLLTTNLRATAKAGGLRRLLPGWKPEAHSSIGGPPLVFDPAADSTENCTLNKPERRQTLPAIFPPPRHSCTICTETLKTLGSVLTMPLLGSPGAAVSVPYP